jgi:hypothetical protein
MFENHAVPTERQSPASCTASERTATLFVQIPPKNSRIVNPRLRKKAERNPAVADFSA